MMANKIEELIQGYTEWLGTETDVSYIGKWAKITTPFLDRHNDFLEVYARRRNGHWEITDDSYVITDLSHSGCDIKPGSHREKLLKTVLKGYGVRREDDNQLVVRASDQEFPERMHFLLQAMMSIDDLFFTAQTQSQTINFTINVKVWLSQSNVFFTPDVKVEGISGQNHSFDFVISGSANKPERVLQSCNHPDRKWLERFIFSWVDTRGARSGDWQAYALLNDESRSIRQNIVKGLKAYHIQPFKWSEREEIIPQLLDVNG